MRLTPISNKPIHDNFAVVLCEKRDSDIIAMKVILTKFNCHQIWVVVARLKTVWNELDDKARFIMVCWNTTLQIYGFWKHYEPHLIHRCNHYLLFHFFCHWRIYCPWPTKMNYSFKAHIFTPVWHLCCMCVFHILCMGVLGEMQISLRFFPAWSIK